MKKVSVVLLTYNHEKFIAQTIEGIVAQKVNFDFELVIGEDFSKDNTRTICEQYANKYPEIINLLPSDKNHGPNPNEVRTLRACSGKYIAICEGDDYWTDMHKLQKQADFLDANEDFTMCFSDVEVIDETGVNNANCYPPLSKDVFTIEDIITAGYCIVPTATLFFRNILPDPLPQFYHNALGSDVALHLLLTDKGKAKYLKEKTAVYRHHFGGLTKTEENIRKRDEGEIIMYELADKYFNYKYTDVFKKQLFRLSKMMLIYGAKNKKGTERIKHYFKRMPNYIKYSNGINLKELLYYHTVLFFPSLLKLFRKPAQAK